jgi:LmbE family N-acetylglucosaminyl deacetylase
VTSDPPRLLVVVAHPDDETFGCGSVIALAHQQGAEVTVCCATRGEAGEAPPWLGRDRSLDDVREAELRAAGALLGVERFVLLGFADSGMDGTPEPGTLAAAPHDDVIAAVRRVVVDLDPDVVVTLDPDHGDGHRDHIVIGRATTAACATMPGVRLYYWAVTRRLLARWFDELSRSRPDSAHLDLDRAGLGRPDEDITTVLDTRDVRPLRERAIAAHRSQVPPYTGLPEDLLVEFFTWDRLVRVQPAWNGGPLERTLI